MGQFNSINSDGKYIVIFEGAMIGIGRKPRSSDPRNSNSIFYKYTNVPGFYSIIYSIIVRFRVYSTAILFLFDLDYGSVDFSIQVIFA